MTAREHRKTHDVKQTEKMIPRVKLPFVTMWPSWGFWVQIDSVKQAIKRDSVASGHVSHRRTSAVNNHLDYRFIVFKNVKQGSEVRRFCVCDNVIHIEFLNIVFLRLGVGVFLLGFVSPRVSPYWEGVLEECNTLTTRSQRSRAGDTVHAKTNVQRNK